MRKIKGKRSGEILIHQYELNFSVVYSDKVTEMLKFLQYRENPVTVHTFRYDIAIMTVDQGNADLYHLMQTLGHKNIQTTKIYLEKHMKRSLVLETNDLFIRKIATCQKQVFSTLFICSVDSIIQYFVI